MLQTILLYLGSCGLQPPPYELIAYVIADFSYLKLQNDFGRKAAVTITY